MKAFLFVLCVFSPSLWSRVRADILNLADVPCGLSGNSFSSRRNSARILGGTATSILDYPFAVSIRKNGAHHCGGTIIHKRFILTAAHCIHSYPPDLWTVIAGETMVRGDETFPSQSFRVTQTFQHPGYKHPNYLNDLAVLELESEIQWTDRTQPACLTTRMKLSELTAILTGWGYDAERKNNGKQLDRLHVVNLPIVDNDQCQEWFSSQGKKVVVHDKHICAGYEAGGKDGCQGDSGGGLIVKESDQFTVTGVMSAGIGCGRSKLPGLYTRTTFFNDWIREIIQNNDV